MRRTHSAIPSVIILAMVLVFVLTGNLGFADKGPKIQFKELKWDFGNKKQGEVLTHTFSFKNAGDETLVIRRVRTSCGCAAAMLSKKELNPKLEKLSNLCLEVYGNRLAPYLITPHEMKQKKNLKIISEINEGIEIFPEKIK